MGSWLIMSRYVTHVTPYLTPAYDMKSIPMTKYFSSYSTYISHACLAVEMGKKKKGKKVHHHLQAGPHTESRKSYRVRVSNFCIMLICSFAEEDTSISDMEDRRMPKHQCPTQQGTPLMLSYYTCRSTGIHHRQAKLPVLSEASRKIMFIHLSLTEA